MPVVNERVKWTIKCTFGETETWLQMDTDGEEEGWDDIPSFTGEVLSRTLFSNKVTAIAMLWHVRERCRRLGVISTTDKLKEQDYIFSLVRITTRQVDKLTPLVDRTAQERAGLLELVKALEDIK